MAKKAKAGDDVADKKKSKKTKIIVVVVALAAGWKLGFIPPGGGSSAADASATTTTTEPEEGTVVSVGEAQTINLADTDAPHYARVGVAVVLNSHREVAGEGHGEGAEGPDAKYLLVQSLVLNELRTWSSAQLAERGAIPELEDTLTEQALETIYEDDEIVRVVFTEFVVQ